MKLTANFTVEEFERSATADKYKINNKIPSDLRCNALSLAQMLQKIREEYGYPIVVSSAYRCPELNRKIGGAVNSDHKYCAAADINATKTTNAVLFNLIKKMIDDNKISCRQLIWEYGTKKEPNWIHISINHKDNSKKNNQILYLGVK